MLGEIPFISVSVVIVNFRVAPLALRCLASIAAERQGLVGIHLQATIVDNASSDGSSELISREIQVRGWADWVHQINAPSNEGFGAGNNLAASIVLASATTADFYFLINPDAETRPSCIAAAIEFARRHPQAGLVGMRIEYPDGNPQVSAFRFPSLLSEFEDGARLKFLSRLLARWKVALPVPLEPLRVDWVTGAAFLVRRELLDSGNCLFDEKYFLYFEETDLARRAKLEGWECWYLPDARVMHLRGQSTGVTLEGCRPNRRPAYWFESRRRYFIKHHGRCYAAFADVAWIVGRLTWEIRAWLQKKPRFDPPWLFYDFIRHSCILNGPAE